MSRVVTPPSQSTLQINAQLPTRFEPGLISIQDSLCVGRTAEDTDGTGFDHHDWHSRTVMRPSTAWTLNATGRKMGQQFRGLLCSEFADRPELFEMPVTPHQWHSKCIEQQKRDRLSTTGL